LFFAGRESVGILFFAGRESVGILFFDGRDKRAGGQDDKVIILVDDVLQTGRSTRAALDALIDLGRPQSIKLAVLVERAGREYPILADYVGFKADVEINKVVQVNLVESDGKDEVVIE